MVPMAVETGVVVIVVALVVLAVVAIVALGMRGRDQSRGELGVSLTMLMSALGGPKEPATSRNNRPTRAPILPSN